MAIVPKKELLDSLVSTLTKDLKGWEFVESSVILREPSRCDLQCRASLEGTKWNYDILLRAFSDLEYHDEIISLPTTCFYLQKSIYFSVTVCKKRPSPLSSGSGC